MDDNRLAVRGLLSRRLVADDQGVCPEGHTCHLVTTPRGTYERGCMVSHDRWTFAAYYGQPVIADGVTPGAIDAAEAAGADRALITWARLTLAERAAERPTYTATDPNNTGEEWRLYLARLDAWRGAQSRTVTITGYTFDRLLGQLASFGSILESHPDISSTTARHIVKVIDEAKADAAGEH